MVHPNEIISIDSEIQSGQPVFAGTRVPIKTLLDYINTGESVETYLEDYPYVTLKQVLDVLGVISNYFLSHLPESINENSIR